MALRLALCSMSGIALITLSCPAFAQEASKYAVPRTTFSQPDIQGVWTNSTLTALERLPNFPNKLVLSEAEAAAIEGHAEDLVVQGNKPTPVGTTVEDLDKKPCEIPGIGSGASCGYNNVWTDPGSRVMRVNGEPRSSFITSTPDGRLPNYKPGKIRYETSAVGTVQSNAGDRRKPEPDDPEERGISERCIIGFSNPSGPVMLKPLYNNNIQIFQSPTEVAIVAEMVHDVRHIRLGGEPRPKALQPYMGDSIGHFEGDTLVIETSNFHPAQAKSFYGASPSLKVIERLTRVGPDRLLYQFHVEDAETWAEPWDGEYEFRPSNGLYEYACHEGNYGLMNALLGGRQKDRVSQGKSK